MYTALSKGAIVVCYERRRDLGSSVRKQEREMTRCRESNELSSQASKTGQELMNSACKCVSEVWAVGDIEMEGG